MHKPIAVNVLWQMHFFIIQIEKLFIKNQCILHYDKKRHYLNKICKSLSAWVINVSYQALYIIVYFLTMAGIN